MKRRRNNLQAFSLPELLVVLVIIGILHTLQKSNFYTHSRYSTSLDDLGFEQSKLVTEGGNANYKIEIVEANEKGFRARATAVVDFDGDGEFNVWEINQDKELKEITKD